MKILYSGLKFNHYDSRRGVSFEHNTFYEGLKALPGTEVIYMPFDRIKEIGKAGFNRELLEAVRREKPDLFFVFMFSDEFDPQALREIKNTTTSVAWFADDHWRFWNYSRRWANLFTWVITTWSKAPELYRQTGQKQVIRSQWAANIFRYRPTPDRWKLTLANGLVSAQPAAERRPEVSFVGSWSRPRERLIGNLEKAGIKVDVWGGGWPNAKRASDEEMIRLFSLSKISLALNPAPGLWNKNSLGRLFFRRSVDRVAPDAHLVSNLKTWWHRRLRQIKARHFEIPACGGFLLTAPADDLENYYRPGKEMAVYRDSKEMLDMVRHYLAHGAEREEMARAAYERTVREHTYEKRLKNALGEMGFLVP